MKINNKFQLLLMSLLCSTSTFAWVNNGPYAGLEVGANNQITDFNNGTFNINGGNSALSGGNTGFAGRFNLGYQFNSYSALELGENYAWNSYINLPNDWGSARLRNNFVDLSYLLSLPITQSYFSVFGRVGINYNWIGATSDLNISGSAFSSEIGAGMKYRATKYVDIRMEWIYNGIIEPAGISANGTPIGKLSSQNFLLGSNYYF